MPPSTKPLNKQHLQPKDKKKTPPQPPQNKPKPPQNGSNKPKPKPPQNGSNNAAKTKDKNKPKPKPPTNPVVARTAPKKKAPNDLKNPQEWQQYLNSAEGRKANNKHLLPNGADRRMAKWSEAGISFRGGTPEGMMAEAQSASLTDTFFAILDRNRNGNIDPNEMLEMFGPKNADVVLDAMDINSSGGVTINEFRAFMANHVNNLNYAMQKKLSGICNLGLVSKSSSPAQLQHIFRSIDTDQSGSIDQKELSVILGTDSADFIQSLEKSSKSKDNKIDMQEFQAWAASTSAQKATAKILKKSYAGVLDLIVAAAKEVAKANKASKKAPSAQKVQAKAKLAKAQQQQLADKKKKAAQNGKATGPTGQPKKGSNNNGKNSQPKKGSKPQRNGKNSQPKKGSNNNGKK